MKRVFGFLFLVILAAIPVLGWIGDPAPGNVFQYETVAGWRLYVAPDWSVADPFPPSGFTHMDLLLSTAPMGFHEPYAFVAQLVTREPERDLDLMLLSKLETGVQYYGRIRVWVGEMIWDQTSEFTFVLENDAPPKVYRAVVPLVSQNFGWETALQFTNAGDESAQVKLTFWCEPFIGGRTYEFKVYARNFKAFWVGYFIGQDVGYHGYATVESSVPIDWTALVFDTTTTPRTVLPFGGKVE